MRHLFYDFGLLSSSAHHIDEILSISGFGLIKLDLKTKSENGLVSGCQPLSVYWRCHASISLLRAPLLIVKLRVLESHKCCHNTLAFYKTLDFCISVYCHLQEFTSTGSANTETSKVSGSLETKYKWAEHGVTFTEKWNTDNTLGTEITVEDQVGDTRISVENVCCDRYRTFI